MSARSCKKSTTRNSTLIIHLGKHQLSARFLFNQVKEIFPVNSTQAAFNQNLLIRNRKISVSDVWSINSNWVNDMRLQYSYFAQYYQNPCASPGGSPGAPCAPDVTLLDLGNSTVGPADNQFQKQNTYQFVDNLSWAHGKHNFKFGVQYMHFIYPQFFLSRSVGDNWYSSTQEFINDLIPSQPGRTLRNAGTGFFNGTQSAIYGFAQDDVKVTPRLTLNLGLRYEFWTNPAGDRLKHSIDFQRSRRYHLWRSEDGQEQYRATRLGLPTIQQEAEKQQFEEDSGLPTTLNSRTLRRLLCLPSYRLNLIRILPAPTFSSRMVHKRGNWFPGKWRSTNNFPAASDRGGCA